MKVNFSKLNTQSFKTPDKKYSSPNKNINFGAGNFDTKSAVGKTGAIDKILNNKLAKSLFKIANKNPFVFTTVSLLVACALMRPATIMLTPGSNQKDKKYAAGKSIIASIIASAGRLLFIIPLGFYIHKLGKKAINNPNFKFPKLDTEDFDALKYLITNAAGFVLSVGMAALMVKAVAKIMKKLVPDENKQNKEKQPIIDSGVGTSLGKNKEVPNGN